MISKERQKQIRREIRADGYITFMQGEWLVYVCLYMPARLIFKSIYYTAVLLWLSMTCLIAFDLKDFSDVLRQLVTTPVTDVMSHQFSVQSKIIMSGIFAVYFFFLFVSTDTPTSPRNQEFYRRMKMEREAERARVSTDVDEKIAA